MDVIKQAEAGLKIETLFTNTNSENSYKTNFYYHCGPHFLGCIKEKCTCPHPP